ncbi:MTG1 GTPase, partial [Mionectes macconnelli]|nr:MTG1 GTPase [Mionectes macconnelli]
RERFDFGGRDVASWFPRHMAKGLRQMQAALRRADCLVERCHIPLSGRNPALKEMLGIRPHVLVLNKMDLADPRRQPVSAGAGLGWVGGGGGSASPCPCLSLQIVPLVARLVAEGPRYHRAEVRHRVTEYPELDRSRKDTQQSHPVPESILVSHVGVHGADYQPCLPQVCEKPLMYLVDTPGVLPPKLEDVETGMKLALCGAIHDHMVGEDIMADYLLYTLNKQQLFGYVQRYGLGEPCDDIESVLKRVALAQGRTQKVTVLTGTGNVNVTMLDYTAAAYEFLQDFRAGRLGRVTMD